MAVTGKVDPQKRLINELIAHYTANKGELDGVLDQLRSHFLHDRELGNYIHSMKWRIKDPSHLRDKLMRKLKDSRADGKPFKYSVDNLFTTVNDLVGFRILHLHTEQMGNINRALEARLKEAGVYKITEGPLARTWDIETAEYFRKMGIKTVDSPTLYTSVHYVVETTTQKRYTCEIQVRTLAEELWGEVEHTINYPHKSHSLACREQLAVLARTTSSCSRLVDAIFRSHHDHLLTLTKITKIKNSKR